MSQNTNPTKIAINVFTYPVFPGTPQYQSVKVFTVN